MWNPARGGFKAHDTATIGRASQGATNVISHCEWHNTCGHCGSVTSRRTAGCELWSPRVERIATEGISPTQPTLYWTVSVPKHSAFHRQG